MAECFSCTSVCIEPEPKGVIIMWTQKFWKASVERAVKTFAQTLVALVGTNAADVMDVDLVDSVQAAAVAAALSVLTSLASSKKGNSGPSLAGESTGE